MPTNRTFFGSFLAAFRAHSAATKASSTSTTSNITSNASTSTATASAFSAQSHPAASARSISTKPTSSASPSNNGNNQSTTPGATTAAVQAANQHLRHASTSPPLPYSHPSSLGGGRHHHTSQSQASPTRSSAWPQARRGSDSSSDSGGFREVLGAEKWYVGGRTAQGDERFLPLGMVRREKSWERRSADQLSL